MSREKAEEVLATLPDDKWWHVILENSEQVDEALTYQVDSDKFPNLGNIFVPIGARQNIGKVEKNELVDFLDSLPVYQYLAAKRILKEFLEE